MAPRSSYAAAALAGVALVVVSCSEQPNPEGPATVEPLAPAAASAAAVPSDEVRRAALARLTREVAVALSNSNVRRAVYRALRASPYREHKLHFRTFLRGSGTQLAAAMAAQASGLTQSGVLASVDSAIDLEFYMPVKSHFANWTGDANLLVATALYDHEIPIAYDLRGDAVPLTSAEVAPATPTLALVPVETDYSVAPETTPGAQIIGPCPTGVPSGGVTATCGGGGGGGGGTPTPTAPGLYMTFSYIPGDYEGFLMGDPEFEIHVMNRKTALDGAVSDVQCAGEHAASSSNQPGIKSAAYAYDQNGSTWAGWVLLFSAAQLNAAQAIDTAQALWVWEDDNDDCKIVKKDRDVLDYIKSLAPLVIGGKNAVRALIKNVTFGTVIAAGTVLLKAIDTIFSTWQNDDIVGLLVPADAVGQTYADATHAIVDKQAVVRGRARLTLIQ